MSTSSRGAGGNIVGSLEVDGNGFANREDVRERAAYEAAQLGGTHLLVASERRSTSWARLTPDSATTTVSGDTAVTTYHPGLQMPVVRPHGAFIVVRVPPSKWLELPDGLRPEPGRDFIGEYPGMDATVRESKPIVIEGPRIVRTAGGWFCASSDDGAEGTCTRTLEECEATASGRGLATCVASSAATCVSSYGTADGARTKCHPTIQSCRAQRQRSIDGGAKIGRECALTR